GWTAVLAEGIVHGYAASFEIPVVARCERQSACCRCSRDEHDCLLTSAPTTCELATHESGMLHNDRGQLENRAIGIEITLQCLLDTCIRLCGEAEIDLLDRDHAD